MAPAVKNSYVVIADVRGLRCVANVGSANGCAVPSLATAEGGALWDRVKCRPGDSSVNTFSRSIDGRKAISIFEAPPALSFSAEMHSIDVQLGRVCTKPK